MVPSPGPYLIETHTGVMGVNRGFETCGDPRGYTGQPGVEGQALLSPTPWTLGETPDQAFSGASGYSGEATSWPKAASRQKRAAAPVLLDSLFAESSPSRPGEESRHIDCFPW